MTRWGAWETDPAASGKGDGESFLVRRNGRAVKELLSKAPPDSRWIRDLEELRSRLPVEVTHWDA
jgi:hypothetical protein